MVKKENKELQLLNSSLHQEMHKVKDLLVQIGQEYRQEEQARTEKASLEIQEYQEKISRLESHYSQLHSQHQQKEQEVKAVKRQLKSVMAEGVQQSLLLQESLENEERVVEPLREKAERGESWEVLDRKDREIKRLSDIVQSFRL